jgi:hypothetical protein
MFMINAPLWQNEENLRLQSTPGTQLHLLHVIFALLQMWRDTESLSLSQMRQLPDRITQYSGVLEGMPSIDNHLVHTYSPRQLAHHFRELLADVRPTQSRSQFATGRFRSFR